MVFDAHTHIFPDKIAERASAGIGEFYDMPMKYDGSVATLMQLCRRVAASLNNSVIGCMVCSVATRPEQVISINDFISDAVHESDGFFTGFCSLHPDMTENELDSELNRVIALGLKGVKLHPDIQKFEADGKAAYRIYEAIDNRLPLLIHAGDSRFSYSSPKKIRKALEQFPDMTVIAAHFGGWSEWDDAVHELTGHENLYVDTCSSLYTIKPEKAREYITVFGEDRVLFGTDYPMWDISDELELIDKLNLSPSVKEKILYKNARKLFNV
ncbi:MAG: amidohydrolase family protein [Oscillospiraceae bacterium]|nr:amidohydrolase family protein [Oscillospiraceae bacterium]